MHNPLLLKQLLMLIVLNARRRMKEMHDVECEVRSPNWGAQRPEANEGDALVQRSLLSHI